MASQGARHSNAPKHWWRLFTKGCRSRAERSTRTSSNVAGNPRGRSLRTPPWQCDCGVRSLVHFRRASERIPLSGLQKKEIGRGAHGELAAWRYAVHFESSLNIVGRSVRPARTSGGPNGRDSKAGRVADPRRDRDHHAIRWFRGGLGRPRQGQPRCGLGPCGCRSPARNARLSGSARPRSARWQATPRRASVPVRHGRVAARRRTSDGVDIRPRRRPASRRVGVALATVQGGSAQGRARREPTVRAGHGRRHRRVVQPCGGDQGVAGHPARIARERALVHRVRGGNRFSEPHGLRRQARRFFRCRRHGAHGLRESFGDNARASRRRCEGSPRPTCAARPRTMARWTPAWPCASP